MSAAGIRSSLGRFARDERGGPATEFVAVAPIFIAMMLATLQIAIIFLAKIYLETGAQDAARIVLTNNAIVTAGGVTSPMTQSQFQTAVCNQLTAFFTCANLVVQLEPLPSTATSVTTLLPQYNANGTLANPTTYNLGSGGQNMVLIVEYPWPVYGGPLGLNFANLGSGTLLMVSTQIFRIES